MAKWWQRRHAVASGAAGDLMAAVGVAMRGKARYLLDDVQAAAHLKQWARLILVDEQYARDQVWVFCRLASTDAALVAQVLTDAGPGDPSEATIGAILEQYLARLVPSADVLPPRGGAVESLG